MHFRNAFPYEKMPVFVTLINQSQLIFTYFPELFRVENQIRNLEIHPVIMQVRSMYEKDSGHVHRLTSRLAAVPRISSL